MGWYTDGRGIPPSVDGSVFEDCQECPHTDYYSPGGLLHTPTTVLDETITGGKIIEIFKWINELDEEDRDELATYFNEL